MANPTTEITLAQLESFFSSCTLPATIQLGPGEKIVDVPKFLENHILLLKSNPALVVMIPHLDRLKKVYAILSGKNGNSTSPFCL